MSPISFDQFDNGFSDVGGKIVDGLDDVGETARIGIAASGDATPELAGPITEAAQSGSGTVSLTAVGSAVTQNFDTLSNTAGSTTSTAIPNGWYFLESLGGARDNGQYAVDTGSGTTGDTYSFGAAGSTDRALGQLRSGTLLSVIGSQFTNNTGSAIGSLAIAYTGEEWRLGTAARTDRMDFQISFDATSLNTGTWADIDQLDFTTPNTVTTGAKDGNAAANRTALSYTYTLGNVLANGASFWIRWNDIDATGADDGLAIDDFTLTPIAAATTPTLSISDAMVTEGNSGTTLLTYTVTASAAAGAGGITFDIATAGTGTATAGVDFVAQSLTSQTIPAGQTTYTFSVVVNGDTVVEPNETVFVNVTNVTGATLTDGQGIGTIVNDDVPPAGTLSIVGTVSVIEGNSGDTDAVFTVTRANGNTGAVSATYTITNGTTDASDFGAGFVSTGTVTFADGANTAEIRVPVRGDTTFEPNETFTVTLSAPTGGASIGTATGTGTITNDDPIPPAGQRLYQRNPLR